jgi:hypothetical protein
MKTYHLWELNGKCPKCASTKIGKIGAVGFRVGSSSKLPEANVDVWQCNDCKHSFHVIK